MTTEGKSEGRHEKLSLSSFGNYASAEFSFIGAPCSVIRNMAESIANQIGGNNCIYVDADHHSKPEDINDLNPFGQYISDKISFQRLENRNKLSRVNYRALNTGGEIALINGNHFSASKQIVIVHPEKLESLSKKLDRITHAVAVILSEKITEVPAFLKDHLEQHNLNYLVLDSNNYLNKLCEIILELSKPKISALVLAGGKSERMGQDKTKFQFHGKPQKEHLFDILNKYTDKVYISCRADQSSNEKLPVITDKFIGLGPYGAILSAFMFDPDKAWLVVASDMPFMDELHINQLISNRNHFNSATSFISPKNGHPEPLACIWEPGSYAHLLNLLSLGYTCPRKALLQTNTHLIKALDNRALMNINTPDEYRSALELFNK